jgi:hypothetical protein
MPTEYNAVLRKAQDGQIEHGYVLEWELNSYSSEQI